VFPQGIQDIFELLEPHLKDNRSDLLVKVHKCKQLTRQVKAFYTPEWPTASKSDLPSKDIADVLVRRYLDTYESVYRVLHIPTFVAEYEAIWTASDPPNDSFIVLVKLVLAIGAATYDEHYSMRPTAIRWLYEAQTWLARPTVKSRLNLQFLQISILHLFTREVTGVGEDFIWTTAGTLHRTAMYMGLHRDPAKLPTCTLIVAEMRRRIWNTILEVTLRSSFMSGGAPLISLDSFDTEPPGNYDDEQLTAENPSPKPGGEFTDTTVSIALRHTFQLRLGMTRFLNGLDSSGAYDEAMWLDAEYREIYKSLRQSFQQYGHNEGPSPTDFQLQTIDLILSRHLLALHLPFSTAAVNDKAYAYSKTIVNDTALKIWSVTTNTTSTSPYHLNSVPERSTLAHLAITTSGFYRISALQASLVLALDFRARLKEEESLGPVPIRRDLSAMLDEAKAWNLRTLDAGEPNAKGYLLVYLVAAHIEGLSRELRGAELSMSLIRCAEEAVETCITLLKGKVALQGPQAEVTGFDEAQVDLEQDGGLFGGWDFLTVNGGLDFGGLEPVSWSSGGWPT